MVRNPVIRSCLAHALSGLLFLGGIAHSKVYDYQEFFDLGLRNRLGMDQLERLSSLALRTAVLSQRPGAGKLTGLLYAAGNLEGGWMIRTPLSEESHDLSQWQTAAALSLAGGPVQLTVAFLGNAFGLNIPFDLPTPTGDPYGGSGNYADNVQKKYLDDYLMVSLGFRGLPFLDWLGFSGTLAINEAFPESAGGRTLNLFAPPESVWLGGSLGASLGNLARVDLLFDPAVAALRTGGILRGADVEFVLTTLIYKIFAPKKYSALAASTWNPQAQDFTRAGVVWAEFSVRACQPAAAAAGSSDPLYRLDVALPVGPFGIGTHISLYGADWLRAPGSIPFHDIRLYGLYATGSAAPLRAEAALGFTWIHDGRLVAYGARTADVFGFDLESRFFLGGRRYPIFGFEFGLRRNHPDDLWTLPDFHGINRFTVKFFGVI